MNPNFSNNSSTDVVEQKWDDDYFMYPNPTQNWVYVEHTSQNTIKEITVRNIEGKLVEQVNPQHFKYYIRLDHYENGIYFVQLTSEHGTLVKKVIKQ